MVLISVIIIYICIYIYIYYIGDYEQYGYVWFAYNSLQGCDECGTLRREPCLVHASYAKGHTERPRAPSGVAAFMSVHVKLPILPVVWIFLWERGSTGARGGSSWILPHTPSAGMRELYVWTYMWHTLPIGIHTNMMLCEPLGGQGHRCRGACHGRGRRSPEWLNNSH